MCATMVTGLENEALKRIGYLYPQVPMPISHGEGSETIVAWIWTRTVKCPNPTCNAQAPLVRSFSLATKEGRKTSVNPASIETPHRPR